MEDSWKTMGDLWRRIGAEGRPMENTWPPVRANRIPRDTPSDPWTPMDAHGISWNPMRDLWKPNGFRREFTRDSLAPMSHPWELGGDRRTPMEFHGGSMAAHETRAPMGAHDGPMDAHGNPCEAQGGRPMELLLRPMEFHRSLQKTHMRGATRDPWKST